jgi:DNA-binding transcriptional LysR family regulator
MDLALLRTFLAVHRAGSLTRAAVDLGLSQPAVTAQIRALEQRVGVELFRRLPRGVAPTAAADELARAVGPHLDALAAGAADNLVPGDTSRHLVRVGCPASLTATLMLPALSPLIEEGLRVVVTNGRTDDLLAALAAGRLDLAIATTRPRIAGITAVPLADEEYVLVGAPRWKPYERASSTPVIDLAEDLPYLRRYWTSVYDAKPPEPAALVIPDLRGVLDAVVAGCGIAVLPRQLCAAALDAGTLVLLDEPEIPPIRTLFLSLRSRAVRGGLSSTSSLRPQATALTAVRDRLFAAASLW